MQTYIVSVFVAVGGIAKKHKDQDALIKGGLEGEDAGVTQIARDGRNNMQARVGESGNGKLDHQIFFSIHFNLRDCTVSISCYLGHLQRKIRTIKISVQLQTLTFPMLLRNKTSPATAQQSIREAKWATTAKH